MVSSYLILEIWASKKRPSACPTDSLINALDIILLDTHHTNFLRKTASLLVLSLRALPN
ncbi:hypothetical protein [Rubritalea tangerina]|uniref:hypothetical protein n=1 Tax=Rubritalea tangerina TaxID=430798 RepID=UPI003623D170